MRSEDVSVGLLCCSAQAHAIPAFPNAGKLKSGAGPDNFSPALHIDGVLVSVCKQL